MKTNYAPGKITQQILARQLGVSQMTVSRVRNNQPGVSAVLRAKILKALQSRHYVRDRMAMGLRGAPSRVIGLIIPDVSASFFPDITAAIERQASAKGYRVILAHSHESYEREVQEVNLLREFRVDGFIIAPAGAADQIEVYRQLQKLRIPFVFMDRIKRKIACPAVVTDFIAGAAALGHYLLKKGYRRWGYLTGPAGITMTEEHRQGLQQVIRHTPGVVKIHEVETGFSEADGYRAMPRLLCRFKPDLVVAINDSVALGAYRLLNERRLRIPHDIALAGFSNAKMTDLLAVPLTTVAEQTTAIGRQAFHLLLQALAGAGRPRQVIRLAPTLIVRASA